MSKNVLLIVGIVIIALFLIVLPSLSKPKVTPKYMSSLVNLRQMGVGLWMYAEDYNDVFPDNIEQLKSYSKYPDNFESHLKPQDFNGPSYVYISGHSFKDAEAKKKYIIAYENPQYLTGYNHEQISVLYLEGYVERLKKEDFLSKLQKTYEYLGKPIPEIKFKEDSQ